VTFRVGLLFLTLIAAGSVPIDAQVRLRSTEVRLLRDAANRESEGDLDGAARILGQILEESPTSSGALFALERVLRASGRVGDLLPSVDRFLAADGSASGVRYMKLRVLTEVDSLSAVRAEAEEWIAEDPSNEAAYREVARIYERAFGPDEALALLRRGRSQTGDPAALALDLGDLSAHMGDRDVAIAEWALAVGEDGAQAVTVVRRIQGLPGEEAPDAGRRLVALVASSEELGKRRAAARIALDLGLGAEALELSQDVAGNLPDRDRETFLADVARRAREQDLVDVASWAYDELASVAASPTDRRQFDLRIVELALASGDTAGALDAQRRVAESYSPGSVDRRRAAAQTIRLESAEASPERLRGLLTDFRSAYPDAPELDDLAATVAAALNARDDASGAASVLEGIEGPRTSLERGYLLLDAGDLEAGRGALLLALTGLPPAQATSIIQFAALFDRVSPAGAELLAGAGVEEHRGNTEGAARALADGVGDLDEADRAPLLAEAARIAARGGAVELSADVNAMIVSEFPDAPEVGDASLALARYYAREPEGVDEAIRLLEDLITQRPNAAVVPDARLELQKLRAGSR
jgi:tetratricopeptide (TPR) repeat protein